MEDRKNGAGDWGLGTLALLIVAIAVFLLAGTGCSALRKTATTRTETESGTTETTVTATVTQERSGTEMADITGISTSVTETDTEVTYTRVTFFPDSGTEPGPGDGQAVDTSAVLLASELTGRDPGPAERSYYRGGVQSIETVTIRKGEAARESREESRSVRTENQESTVTDVQAEETTVKESEVSEETTDEPAKDPRRWRYILALAVLGTLLLAAGGYAVWRIFFKK